MTEFWESSFQDKQTMWGFDPVDCAISTAKLFRENGIKNVLIPGFGYGRNAKPFIENGCTVTGIEISQTAIDLAEKHLGDKLTIYHGSVGDMPFDNKLYDGIFCYALIHLLNKQVRRKLIKDCYNQLSANGIMVFITISKQDGRYGQGKEISPDTFETNHGVELYFYDKDSVQKDFGKYGLMEMEEISEPSKITSGKNSQRFMKITCSKTDSLHK